MKGLYRFCGGRTMTMAWAVLTLGTTLALLGKLTGEYVTLLTVVQALTMARAAAEDKFVKQVEIRNGKKPGGVL